MIEQEIENRISGKISSALSACGLEHIQIMDQLSTSPDELKGVENANLDALVVVKASPRSYATATIPTCSIPVTVNVLIRADRDWNGANYISVSDKILGLFQTWQRCLDDAHETFEISGTFAVSGYQLNDGDFTFVRDTATWQYTHNMTIYGVVQ